MSFNDKNKFSIPTIYNGIKMRSKLESKIAYFLDCLNIKWIYESQAYLLSTGIMYHPDFYLPELKTWIEVKGIIEEHNKEYSKTFVEDNKTNLILISSNQCRWFGEDNGYICEDDDILIGLCIKCNHWFFCSNISNWNCTNCNYFDGAHIIKGDINGNKSGNKKIDFNDLTSIKGWLNLQGLK